MIPLTLCKPGEELEVVDILGGIGAKRRLTEMGIYPGVKLSILLNPFSGPLLIGVGNSRLALGRGIAQKILVKPTNRR